MLYIGNLKKLPAVINHQNNLSYSYNLTDFQKSIFLSHGTLYSNRLSGGNPSFKTKTCSEVETWKRKPILSAFPLFFLLHGCLQEGFTKQNSIMVMALIKVVDLDWFQLPDEYYILCHF